MSGLIITTYAVKNLYDKKKNNKFSIGRTDLESVT